MQHRAGDGWSGKKNGVLAGMAEGSFDVLLTVDQRFNYEMKPKSRLAIFIVSAKTNKIEDLEPFIPAIREALQSLKPGGGVIRIPGGM